MRRRQANNVLDDVRLTSRSINSRLTLLPEDPYRSRLPPSVPQHACRKESPPRSQVSSQ